MSLKNKLQNFNNSEFGEIRTIEKDNKVWFCGRDVAKALGYSDAGQAIRKNCKKDGVSVRHLTDNLGRTQQAKFIDEGNLYRLICNSKLPSAEKFERWVFDEVLPSIRKHGLYAVDELLNNPDVMIKVLTELKTERAERKRLESTVAIQEQQIEEMKPKATYYDIVLNCNELLPISVISKDYGKTAQWMNNYLHEKGIQYKQGNVWLLYKDYADRGYTQTKTRYHYGKTGLAVSVHTCWTQKGRLFLYDLLKKDGHIPTMELERESA